MSELKPCPLCHSKEVSICYDLKRNGDVACSICGCSADINAWNQRQPHPDSALLEFTFKHKIAYVKHPKDNWSLILDEESIYGGETPREAIQQAMEQEK